MFRTLAAAAALTLISSAALASPLGVWATEKNDEGNYLTVEINHLQALLRHFCNHRCWSPPPNTANNQNQPHCRSFLRPFADCK